MPLTDGSSRNWIEAELPRHATLPLNATNHPSYGELNATVTVYLRWRNARAQPKTNFAVG